MDCSLPGFSVHGILQASTGVVSHSLLQRIFSTQGLSLGLLHCRHILYCLSHQRSPKVVKVLVVQWCPTFCDSMGCSLPGFPVHGTLQARILEWIAVLFSRGSSQPMDRIQVFCRWILYCLSHQGSTRKLEWVAISFSRGSSQPRD